MKKRVFSFLLVLVMIISMLPTSAIALTLGNGTEEDPYQVGSTVTNDGSAEPDGFTVENTHWVKTEEVAATENLVCQLDEHDHAAALCEAAYENVACLLEGHPTEGELTTFTHEDGTVCTYDAENAKWVTNMASGYTCGMEAHTHTAAAGCIEVTPAYTVWTLTADDINPTADSTDGTDATEVTESTETEQTERICEEGCILESEEEHLENGGECLVWIPCTLTEGCEGPEGHEGECYGAALYPADDQGRLPIHFFLASPGNITNPNGTYTNYYVPLDDSENEAWTIADIKEDDAWSTMYTQNGIRNVSDENIIRQYVGSWPTDDESTFKDFGSVRIGGVTYYDTDYEIKWVSIMCRDNSHSSSGMRCNQRTYSGEHIHIDGLLVEKILPGEMEVYKTIPEAVNHDVTFQFRLEKMLQPNLTSPPASANAVDGSFTPMTLAASIPARSTQAPLLGGSEISFGYYKLSEVDSADWQNAGIALTDSRGNTEQVKTDTLYICIAPNGTVLYSTTVSGPYTAKARVAVQNERQDVTVNYQWRVYNLDSSYTDNLPAGLGAHGLPASVNDMKVGSEFVYNTGYVQGTSYYDYSNGLLYTFHGWDTWSHNSTWNVDPAAEGYYELDDGDQDASNNKTIPITADTWINGYWTVSELTPSDAYLMVKKVVKVADGGDADYVKNYLRNIGKMYISIDPGIDQDGDDAAQVDVDYAAAVTDNGYRIDVYQYTAPFVFTEYQADVPGYTRTVEVSVSANSNLSGSSTTDTASITISPEYDPNQAPYNLGTVTYTNTYTKNTGSAVSEYPELTLSKTASDTGDYQSGVVFGLYSDADCTNSIGTCTTAASGSVVIPFNDMTPGTYYLKELTPAPGYKADASVYQVTLTAGAPVEELRNGEYVQVTYYTLSVTVPEGAKATYRESRGTGIDYHLHVYNDPILGSLTVSKTTQGLDKEDKDSLNAVVIVHGPITRDSSNAITDIGSTWTMNLNSENSWKDSISNLPVGEYLVHESFASVHGYTWTSVTYGSLNTVVYNGITSGVFEISEDSTNDHSVELALTNAYEEWSSADFYIKKVGPNGVLPGATFEIFVDAAGQNKAMPDDISGENVTLSATTGADGYAHFSGYTVPDTAGEGGTVTFYLKETKAPAGYYLDSTVYKVEIKAVTADGKTTFEPKITTAEGTADFNNTTDLLTVTNSAVLGKLTISKAFANGTVPVDADGNALISNIKVQVTGPNGYAKTVELSSANSWAVTLEGLRLGEYTLTELDASAPGYDWEVSYSSRTVTLTESDPGYTVQTDVITNSASITNTYTRLEETYEIPTTLTVKKVGEDGTTALAGAVFKLDRMSADGNTVVDSKSYTTNAEGIVVFDLLSGWIVNNDDVDGTYILSETKAPDGYQLATESWTVSIKDNDGNLRVTLNKDKNIFENFWDWIVGGITGNKEELYTFADNVLTVKNIELADLTVTKSFALQGDSGMVTPPEGAVIEVAVLDSSNQVVKQLELTASNNWTVQVHDIPAGTYTIRENSPSLHGYTWKGATFTVTGAEHTTSSSSVTVTVVESADVKVDIKNTYTTWESADFYVMKTKADGTTPLAGATFALYDADGNDVTNTHLHIDAAIHTNNGNTTGSGGILHFQNIAVASGQTATFTLKETSAPANYYANGNKYKITVSHTDTGYDITVTDKGGNVLTVDGNKAVFNGGNDVLTVVNDEILADIVIKKTFPDSALTLTSVKVDVTGPNGYSNTVTLDNSNAFEVTLSGLSLGEYTIKEQEAAKAGYSLTVKYNGEMKESHTVTLTQANDNEAVNVSITNTYVADIHNPASFQIKKVDSVTKEVITTGATFTLYSDEACTVPVQVQTTGENGIATFEGFNKAETYYLKETVAPNGYEAVGTVWKVEIVLQNGKPTIQVNDTTNLWETIYDWIVGSITPDSQWANGVLTVENVKKTGELMIVKNVTDPQNHYGDAEYSFTLTLSDRTEPVTFTLKAGESKLIKDIPWGTTYTLTENTTGAAYRSEMTDSGNGKIWSNSTQINVTNTYAYQTHNNGLNLVKVDADDTSKVIAGAGFTLYSDVNCKNKDKVGEEVFSDTTGALKLSITEPGTYYLKETTTPTGYHPNEEVYVVTAEQQYVVLNAGTANAVTEIQMHITIAGLTGTTSNQIDYTYSIKNTAIKTVVVTVEKVWDDGSYHARPESVEVTLYRDNEVYATVTLNEDNSWRHTWNDLTDEYSWTVDEVNVPDEYRKTVTNNGNNWTITNARTPKPVEITVTKAWNHNGGKNLPESISVTLYKDGAAYQTVELSEENDWTHTWSDLNDASVWSIDETEVPTGYDKKIEVDGYKFKITNTRIINPVEIHVKKVWVASEGVEHPESIEVVLYRDGKKHDTVKLNEKNGWAYSWTGLTDEYTWTVDEKEVPAGYTKNVAVEETVTEGKYSYDYTITNTKDFKYIDVSVKKIWNGAGVAHPTSVKVTLYRNGVAYDTVTLSASNNWKYTWEDLTDEFTWEVDEPSVPSGYNKTVRVYNTYDYYISNTHEDNPKTGDFTSFLGLGALGMVGVIGFVYTAFLLFVPRKKGKYER